MLILLLLPEWLYNPVIQIVGQIRLILPHQQLKLLGHHALKEWRRIFQAKVNHSGYVGSKHGLECGFVLISLSNPMIFVALPDVKLGEQLFTHQFLQLSTNIREGTIVLHDPFV